MNQTRTGTSHIEHTTHEHESAQPLASDSHQNSNHEISNTHEDAIRILVHSEEDGSRLKLPYNHLDPGQASYAPSESGTEADDERPSLVKALPAPTLRPRKGLRTGEQGDEAYLTPSQLDDDGRRRNSSAEYFPSSDGKAEQQQHGQADEEEEILLRRRLSEFLRRLSEVLLMGVITLCVLCGRGVAAEAWKWKWELLVHIAIIGVLILAYPIKLSIVDTQAKQTGLWQRFRVPASFDPATVLYPPLLPVLVALSVAPSNTIVVLPNVILGLSSLPQRLFPRSSRSSGLNVLHWFLSIVPLLLTHDGLALNRKICNLGNGQICLTHETLVMLYPLHHALMQPLHYLTSTSLLISELHLLSAALINLSLLATSPQTVILKSCLWIGGVVLFVFCQPVLGWNLALARVPKWKLRRDEHPSGQRKSFVDAVTELVSLQRAASAFRLTPKDDDSDADEDEPRFSMKQKTSSTALKSDANFRGSPAFADPIEAPEYQGSAPDASSKSSPQDGHPRNNNLTDPAALHPSVRRTSVRKKAHSANMPWYLQLTTIQATRRKWLYAALTYVTVLAVVLGPIRSYIGDKALAGQEPVGWAVGYLFGQISYLRYTVEYLALDSWIPLPAFPSGLSSNPLLSPLLARAALGRANTRLLIIIYWAMVLAIGLVTVFILTSFVEVDTRRKVFHGVMVAMLLPATYIDPCFCALALSGALAIFLLLEVIRAGQIAPFGNAIGRFVAPYVDGRDLKGPVVVSHIFLLVGCAMPLWFSLASFDRAGDEAVSNDVKSNPFSPWQGWELPHQQREVAMLAGVVCVGLGDAAASLIGRRIGRHKWRWVGGKSLEGSAAFAFAVTIGLLAAKLWLRRGGWNDADMWSSLHGKSLMGGDWTEWAGVLVKAGFCACAASFMEAVLTGANDNVVVPIALWLLVKGVRL